ncbi:polyketide cyclase [Paenibacillus sp. FSL R7-0273]|uniref:SRPBCC domain-containing protein n=1 Tax=Paenibacillus sp. FSL R7-0273 TaxID=1536772 RepID=UPI0004F8F8A3|nr:SRPBCC domain-containing protein [Paenibacillus sp. FSL R7-0273]AIQ45345.1 polyketide cyclase [Paenibacillus sp. FSL R7-0273]OMF90030.1 polyketide cyclase [Paenibacillus sp. FSL R7-0273]
MKELKYEFYIGAAPAAVWDCLVSPDKVAQIYYGSTIRSSFTEGERLEYAGPGADGDDTVHVYGTVLEYRPQEALRFTHHAGPSYVKEGEDYESVISWLLSPAGGCTKLTLIHGGWHPDDPSYGPSDSAWWHILSNTKTLAETGRTLDFGG